MKTNLFYSWLTPALAYGVTLLGFVLLKPDSPSAVYWINMVYAFFLEALFFIWLHKGHAEIKEVTNQTPYFKVFLGVCTLYYIGAAVLWMIYYFLCGTELGRRLLCVHFDLPEVLSTFPEMSVRLYLFGILALTVIWIVVASIVGQHDVEYNTQHVQLEQDTEEVRLLGHELRDMAEQYSNPANEREWNRLIREADSILPSQVARERGRIMAKANKLVMNNQEIK